jgi:HlyD family secretion protein
MRYSDGLIRKYAQSAAAATALALVLNACAAKPPQVRTSKVRRETIVSTLTTNGKVEPLDWTAVRAERDGVLARVLVRQGQMVARGQILAEIRTPESASDIAAAEARQAQAAANVLTLERGGAPQALAELDGQLATARQERTLARREADAVARLVERGAATKQELTAAQDRISTADTTIRSLEARRDSLGGTWEARAAAEAQQEEAGASVTLARSRAALAVIRAPMAGEVYNLPARDGLFVRTGDVVAEIGRTAQLKAIVYVDEPLLGRVARGMAVRITWDAVPDRAWTGQVDKLPTQIVSVGNRQVGEVTCTLDNADRRLPAGANINVEILSAEAASTLTIPKEALRRQGQANGVFLVEASKLAWREVQVGISSLTRTEVKGLKEGDTLALPGETTLTNGLEVLGAPEP